MITGRHADVSPHRSAAAMGKLFALSPTMRTLTEEEASAVKKRVLSHGNGSSASSITNPVFGSAPSDPGIDNVAWQPFFMVTAS